MAEWVIKAIQNTKETILQAPLKFLITWLGITIPALLFFAWQEMVEPRIDRYFMRKMNQYFSDELENSANRILSTDNKIENKSKKLISALGMEIDNLRDQLFSEVDSVYPVYVKYTDASLRGFDSSISVPLSIFADPKRHRINITLQKTKESPPIDVDICINGITPEKCIREHGDYNQRDLTSLIIKSQNFGAGNFSDEDDVRKSNTQRIIIKPSDNNQLFKAGVFAIMEGYIVVARARPASNAMKGSR